MKICQRNSNEDVPAGLCVFSSTSFNVYLIRSKFWIFFACFFVCNIFPRHIFIKDLFSKFFRKVYIFSYILSHLEWTSTNAAFRAPQFTFIKKFKLYLYISLKIRQKVKNTIIWMFCRSTFAFFMYMDKKWTHIKLLV